MCVPDVHKQFLDDVTLVSVDVCVCVCVCVFVCVYACVRVCECVLCALFAQFDGSVGVVNCFRFRHDEMQTVQQAKKRKAVQQTCT